MKTRGLFLEFTLYNANVNLFGSVIMLVEWMAAGSAITRAEVKVKQRWHGHILTVLRLNQYMYPNEGGYTRKRKLDCMIEDLARAKWQQGW